MPKASTRAKHRLLLGMIHLPPLPGSPRGAESLARIESAALREAGTLLEAGFDGILVENYGDAPFFPDNVPPVTVSAMTRVALAVRRLGRFPLGVNVLRNDAAAALSIAAVIEAQFIRVNVHTGVSATDQGILQGRAHETLRLRKALGVEIEIWADVQCKHSRPLADVPLEEAARDLAERAGADSLILTGPRTGEPADPGDLERLAALRLGRPLFVGSGVTEGNLHLYRRSDGAIVGSSVRRRGVAGAPIDPGAARRLAAAWKELT